MMSEAAQTLSKAFEFIEQGDLSSARNLLDSIRSDHEDNPEFWWVYAHAVESEAAGRDALNRVLSLDANYPGAGDLLEQLDSEAAPGIRRLKPTPGGPPSPPALPEDEFDDFDDFDDFDFDDEEEDGGNRLRNVLFLVALVVVIILAVAAILPSLQTDTEPPTSDASAAGVTANPTDTAEPVDTTEPPTELPTIEPTEVDFFAELAAQLAQFNVPPNGIAVEDTTLGNTLIISICAAPGPMASQAIGDVLDTLKPEPLADDIEGIGFSITNCSEEMVIRVIGVSRADYDQFASNEITRVEFQQTLRPIN